MKYRFFILFTLSFFGCVSSPDEPDNSITTNNITQGAIILNEARRGSDNASITKYDLLTFSYDNNYFKKCNPKLKLGDNANDVII